MLLSQLPRSLLLLLSTSLAVAQSDVPESQQPLARAYTQLSDLRSVAALPSSSKGVDALNYHDPTSLLSQILIPRAPGSANLTQVQQLISRRFAALTPPWHVLEDRFTADTPIGSVPMCNLVYTHNPEAPRKLVLAAHLDSKYFPRAPENQFVGATDSAASVALLVDLAERITPWLNARQASLEPEVTLSIVLFDGEEAFQTWTATDSIYGARHLAELWAEPMRSPSATTAINTPLQQITTFVLLDLIGSPNPVIHNFYHQTGWLYDRFVQVESRLRDAGLLWENMTIAEAAPKPAFFRSRQDAGAAYYGRIEDDHLPFLHRGVPVVHMIPVPFPVVWHTLADDASSLDFPTLKTWSIILRTVVSEYLALNQQDGTVVEERSSTSSAKGNREELVRRHGVRRWRALLTSVGAAVGALV